MKAKPGDRLELTVEALDARGNGLAEIPGLTVRLRGALPGDRVQAVLRKVRRRRGEAEGRVAALLEAGISRVAPRCSHTAVCGGCLWQDIPYDRQLALKQEMVAQCLRQAGLPETMCEPLGAGDPFYYRNKMEYSVGRARDGAPTIGLHHSGSYDRVFDLEACHLQSDASNAIVDTVRAFAARKGLT
jgi:23S rRNA (uracil1939-C5)-methyltransferase